MKLLIFTKEDAPEMRKAKDIGSELEAEGYQVEYLDLIEEGAIQKQDLYDIYATPSFIVVRENGEELDSWRGVVPLLGDIKNSLNH